MIEDKLEKMLAEMSHVWKTESAYYTWLRGSIRRAMWSKNPVKLEFIKRNRIKIPNPNPKGRVKEVWGAVCALTGDTYPINEMEVDHKVGNHSLTTLDDLVGFIKAIAMVTLDDLQFVSKEAHKIKTFSERYDVDFDTARAEKEAKQLVDKKLDKAYLQERQLPVSSTQSARRATIVEHKLSLLKEKDDECI